jgi:predicted Zn-dependent protease
LNFDLETAISVCRQAGYFEHAVYLAEKFHEHNLYLDIVIEDTHQYGTALEYIRRLNSGEAEKNLQKYSKTLLCHLPQETTELLIELCTGSLSSSGSNSSSDTATAKAALNNLPFSNSTDAIEPPITKSKRSSQNIPSPRKFMPAFVDRPDCLTQFLEAIYDTLWGNSTKTFSISEQEERKTIWNTLLELYLMENTRQVRQKALALLKDDTVAYDTNQALVLCQLKQFDEGIVYLYEKTGMYKDILRYWMEKGGTDRVIEGVRKYG